MGDLSLPIRLTGKRYLFSTIATPLNSSSFLHKRILKSMVKMQRFGSLSNYALLKNTKKSKYCHRPLCPAATRPHCTIQPQAVFRPQLPLIRAKAIKKHPMQGGFYLWRMGRDSNPRKSCPFSGFQDRRIRPLCHPSETVLNQRSFKPAVLFVAQVLVTVRVYSIFIFYALQL